MRGLKIYILIGVVTESVVFGLALLTEDEPWVNAWTNALQTPGGPAILHLARLPAVRGVLASAPLRATVHAEQFLGWLIQAAVFAAISFCIACAYRVFKKQPTLPGGTPPGSRVP
jgi:hypothetical protein